MQESKEAKQIESYYLRKHKETGHTEYLYPDGLPYRNLVITENNGVLTATCEIKFVWFLNGWDKSVVTQDRLIKKDGNWLSGVFYYMP